MPGKDLFSLARGSPGPGDPRARRPVDRVLPAHGGNELAVLQGERVETLLIARQPIEEIARVSASPRLGKLVLPGGPLVFELVPP